jgi:hypothetical protein
MFIAVSKQRACNRYEYRNVTQNSREISADLDRKSEVLESAIMNSNGDSMIVAACTFLAFIPPTPKKAATTAIIYWLDVLLT